MNNQHHREARALRGMIGLTILAAAAAHTAAGVADDEKKRDPEAVGKGKQASRLLVRDSFDRKLHLNWRPVRHDPTHVSLTKQPGRLTITTQRGSIHGEEKADPFGEGIQAGNIFVIENPLDLKTDFVVTTEVVGFTPATTYQQAGLILYDDDDNYLKWGYEYNWPKGGGQTFVLVREVKAKPDHHFVEGKSGLSHYWLRITRRGDRYECSASSDGKKFVVYGEKTWGGGPRKIGLLAKNGGSKAAPEVDAGFEFFELQSPIPKRKD